MSHLLREHAPITEATWREIDEEAREQLRPALAARRLVDFGGPHGWEYSATNIGRVVALSDRPGEGVEAVDAEAGVGFSFLKERFSTRVRRDPTNSRIDVSLLSGPFKHLANRWEFYPAEVGTRVEFDIDFQFKSRLLEALLAANFGRAVDRLMECFEARAKALYGTAEPAD